MEENELNTEIVKDANERGLERKEEKKEQEL
jgi:hypothetical protein